jgi:cytochrome c
MNVKRNSVLVPILLALGGALTAAPNAQLAADPDLELSILATGIREGMEMSIAQDGRVFVAERPGKVKLWHPDRPGGLTELIDLKSDTRREAGLIGIALDPNFEKNNWIYLQHTVPAPDDPAVYMHHLGRFTVGQERIDRASEKVLLKIRASAENRIHEAGSIAFGPDGLLYLSVGDNQIRSEYLFSCKTSANSNDLRGKILRIRPTTEGGYTIPEGNLFPPGTPKTRPEIYIMGLRNPFRIHVDSQTRWLLWGENGPPNNWAPGTPLDKQKSIPLGYDEFNLAKRAGFYGYPLVIANQEPFTHYDPATKKTGPRDQPQGAGKPASRKHRHPQPATFPAADYLVRRIAERISRTREWRRIRHCWPDLSPPANVSRKARLARALRELLVHRRVRPRLGQGRETGCPGQTPEHPSCSSAPAAR